MKSIIKELYDGKIYPAEQMKPILDEYKKRQTSILIEEWELFAKLDILDKDLKMKVDNLIGQFFDLVPDEIAEVFAEGFSYGVRFMIEALYIHKASE